MDHDEFIGNIQNRLDLPSRGDADQASRAVLQTLGERIQAGTAKNLASPLPQEIDRYLTDVESEQDFDRDEFLSRVADRADIEKADALFYVQVLINLVHDAVPVGALNDVQNSLPEEYQEFFEFTERDVDPGAESSA